eukprot:gene29921-39092_t
MKINFEYFFIILLLCRSLSSQKVFEYDSAKPHHQILEDLKYFKDRSDYWRKEAGSLSCKVNGLGPNGGFCLDPVKKESVGGNQYFDKGIAEEMSTLFLGSKSSNVSVVDFGCGFGQYGQYFKTTWDRIEWVGYDGSENIESVTSGFVKFIDLAEPKFLGTNYDWTISIEVAEHLPIHLESNFLYMLHVHNKMGMIITWAVPGQDGHHHVNCQSNSYVKCVMTKLLNYTVGDEVTAKLQSVATLPWTKKTAMAFFKAKDYTPTPWHVAAKRILSKFAMGSKELEDMHTKALHESGCWELRNIRGT